MQIEEKREQYLRKTSLKFDRGGLIPAVIVDDTTSEVLMMAFMNQEALQRTRETGYTHCFSRSRNTIWRKGEQSGNEQEVCAIFVNCEENSLLLRVIQHGGAACHDGYRGCYYRRLLPDGTYTTIAERVFDPATVYHTPRAPAPELPIANGSAKADELAEIQHTLEHELAQLYG